MNASYAQLQWREALRRIWERTPKVHRYQQLPAIVWHDGGFATLTVPSVVSNRNYLTKAIFHKIVSRHQDGGMGEI